MSHIEAKITPVEGQPGQYDVITTEKTRDRFRHIGAIGTMLWKDKWGRTINLVAGTASIVIAAAEVSKYFLPTISTSVPAGQVLEQISNTVEQPAAIAVLAVISTAYFTKEFLRERTRSQTIRKELQNLQLCPPTNSQHPPDE